MQWLRSRDTAVQGSQVRDLKSSFPLVPLSLCSSSSKQIYTVMEKSSRIYRFVENWIVIPITCCSMLAYVWGISKLIQRIAPTSSFPGSVAGMVILFALLYASMLIVGLKPTNKIVGIITPATDFLLKWINVLFCPALIMVPNTPSVSPIEVGKIAAIFVAGFLIFITVSSLIIRLMRLISPFKSKSKKEEARDEENDAATTAGSLQSNQGPEISSSPAFELGEMTTHPRLGDDASQLTLSPFAPNSGTATTDAGSSVALSKPPLTATSSRSSVLMPEVGLSTASVTNAQPLTFLQHALGHLRHLTISHYVYLALLLVSTPAYLSFPLSSPVSPASRTLAELACVVLAYLAALTVPLRVRFFLHPMITCTAITLTFIAIIEVIKGRSFMEGLNDFSTGRRYLVILGGGGIAADGKILWPGAGDVLFSLMDAAIVSLGVVMFKYRAELKKHFFEMSTTILILALLTLSIYPLMAHAMGISPARSLSLVARSVTTPLAIPFEGIIRGDVSLSVCLIIMTGISGTIVTPVLMRKVLRIKDDDYLAIGVTMGCNSHAIGTAYLLVADPRAAAISSLSFVLFGTMCVVLVSIPVVPEMMWAIVGLK